VLLGSMLRAVGDAAMGQQTVMTQLAQGRMVPTLQRGGSARVPGRPQTESYVVRWIAAVVDRERIRQLSARMPGPVRAFTPAAGAARLCRGVLNAAVDAICRAGVVRLVTAAVPPVARSRRDVAEALLAGLAGEVFAAARGPATEVANDLRRWAAPVVGDGDVGLIVRLEPPDADGGWLLTVDATGLARHPLPVERAVTASGAKARRVNAQLRRLERLVPALGRTGRRGQAVLGVDAAWEFMTRTGRVLQSAGFDVRVPAAWRARPLPRLRLEAASPVGPARVGPTGTPGPAGRCCSTTSSSTPPPSPGSPPKPGRWSAPGVVGSSSTGPTSRPPPGRWPSEAGPPRYHGGLTRGTRDRMIREFQEGTGPGALVLSIKAGGSGLDLTAANHVLLCDRWWKEEVVAGKRRIADLVLPARSSVGDLTPRPAAPVPRPTPRRPDPEMSWRQAQRRFTPTTTAPS
jgi:hypothetical protein